MLTVRDGLKISGKIKIDTYRAGFVDAAIPVLDELQQLRKLKNYASSFRVQQLKAQLQQFKDRFYIATPVECSNLVVDSPNYGIDLIIQRLVGINTYSLNLTWIEIGTGSTTPTANDTALTSPSIRAAVNFQEDYGTTDAIVQAYITDADLPNATYYEVGAFVDGTSTIGSGQMFNHALLSPTFTKTSGVDTTLQIDVNIVN